MDLPLNRRILLLTGEGKGKTSSSLGMALRAWGHGMKTAIVHFVKSRQDTGEVQAIKQIASLTPSSIGSIDQYVMGLGFLPKPESLHFPKHKEAAKQALAKASLLLQEAQHDLFIFDEICWAIHRNLIPIEKVLELLPMVREKQALVLTGRCAHPSLIQAADTVTEMKAIKHAYAQGVSSWIGIEK